MKQTNTWCNMSRAVRRLAPRQFTFGLLTQRNSYTGQEAGKCDRMVSFTSRVWVLVIRHRRRYPNEQSEIPRSLCCRCSVYLFFTFSHVFTSKTFASPRLTQTAQFLLAALISVHSGRTQRTTRHQMPQRQSIKAFP